MLGAAAAAAGRTVVLAAGDGGFLMSLADLESIVRTVESGIIVIYNDSAYGAEIHQYGSQGLHEGVMEIEQADFARLATGFGAQGLVVETMEDLEGVRAWVGAGAHGTLVVDLRISRTVVAPYIQEIVEKTIKK